MKIAILKNEDEQSSAKWELACKKQNLKPVIIDLTSHNWLFQLNTENFDFLLAKPPGKLSHYKNLYDERLYILSKVLNYQIYPSYEECYIYENKKLLSYYLAAKDIPHPKTWVFYRQNEALSFCKSAFFPIVAKTSIGASGSGVVILKNYGQSKNYINKAFSAKGIKRRFGPNRVTGKPSKWLIKAFNSPQYFISRLKEYVSIYKHGERDFVIFQKYIPHDFEWRSVRIGDSYFAHKKIKHGEKASGSKGIEYVDPPHKILNFTKALCEKNNFNFMAIDIFEYENEFFVNELQTIFGHVQDHIMEVNGIPGRYCYIDDQWIFEPGDFNTNESYDLRLETAIALYEKHKR